MEIEIIRKIQTKMIIKHIFLTLFWFFGAMFVINLPFFRLWKLLAACGGFVLTAYNIFYLGINVGIFGILKIMYKNDKNTYNMMINILFDKNLQ